MTEEDDRTKISEASQTTDAARKHRLAPPPRMRVWTERLQHPIKYSRSSFIDPNGKYVIAFRFDLPAGKTRPSQEILDVLRDHKKFTIDDSFEWKGTAGPSSSAVKTGLHYQDYGPGLGKLWVIPDGKLGRAVADSLDVALNQLAQKIDHGATRDY